MQTNARSGLISLFALLSLTACERVVVKPEIVEVPVVKFVEVPPTLTRETPAPSLLDKATNAELVEWCAAILVGLQQCNTDKAAIRKIKADK